MFLPGRAKRADSARTSGRSSRRCARGLGQLRGRPGRKISFGETATSGIDLARVSNAVLDASVVVRALAYFQPSALEWVQRVALAEVRAAWPTLLYVEVTNALLDLSRGRHLTPEDARLALDSVMSIPVQVTPVRELVEAAWDVANERALSAYDACYVVLAESLDAPLVTTDRRLSDSTPNGVLLTV